MVFTVHTESARPIRTARWSPCYHTGCGRRSWWQEPAEGWKYSWKHLRTGFSYPMRRCCKIGYSPDDRRDNFRNTTDGAMSVSQEALSWQDTYVTDSLCEIFPLSCYEIPYKQPYPNINTRPDTDKQDKRNIKISNTKYHKEQTQPQTQRNLEKYDPESSTNLLSFHFLLRMIMFTHQYWSRISWSFRRFRQQSRQRHRHLQESSFHSPDFRPCRW